ncbi:MULTISPECIES: glycogen synthase GlgA [Marinomonas]|uniref:Glycogen synthase n=1 Tax=Marinomonas arctica TaxID=383750 RepID=A0A7H1J932_9GAMM|nr:MULTISPECIES: glycogen synthase GlgA [Marinomonas]MCS7487281.1 glycogen synthase [Marinomonas sp. BSi20414]QNT06998.1 glycogen synthase GlgA [Marinomonas arctica]GGN35438.1 glycogen synthase [Marinomonas arctica]
MKILFAASEIYPLIKTGGLADVAGALPVALRNKGHDIKLIMPAYQGILNKVAPIQKSINLGNPFGVGDLLLLETHIPDNDTPIWLLQCQALYEREDGPYVDKNGVDFQDNHLRFAALSWAIATLALHGNLIDWQADILHLNDWQTGFAAAYLKSWKVNHIPIVTTVHNLRYNGSFDMNQFSDTHLSAELLSMHGMEFYGRFSGLKAGLVYADAITTVSPTYAQEILTPEYGDGLDGTLRAMQDKLSGILNGVDYNQWSPEKDTLIPQNYGIDTLHLKQTNKLALLRENSLSEDLNYPVFGVVSRLTEQKGLDLVLQVMPALLEKGARLIVLGSGDKYLESGYLELQKKYPQQVAVRIGYFEDYSHRIQAGIDALLIPSRFEPCGLTQLYALKYATLPVVRQTGGLADTVFEEGDKDNGFVFKEADEESLKLAMERCMACFYDGNRWQQKQQNAMCYDYSWEAVTDQWVDLYQSLLNR